MPLPIVFDWSEDENTLDFVLRVRGVKAKNVDVLICDVYVKVNCPPSFFEVDLLHDIDPDHPTTYCRVARDKVSLRLRKRAPALWHQFRAEGSKAELRLRREEALAAARERESARLQKRADWRQEMLKAGEHEQWRLDRENRETIERWEQQEKEQWERDVYSAFDEETKDLLDTALPCEEFHASGGTSNEGSSDEETSKKGRRIKNANEEQRPTTTSSPPPSPLPAAPPSSLPEQQPSSGQAAKAKGEQPIWTDTDLDDTEEYVPAVRENPGKVGIRFTERPRPGVPVRDRGQRLPPLPKDCVKSNQPPPMLAGDDADESDPVWLKDKADNLMVAGDYQGAYNAYTEALKIGPNAKAFANRAVADLYLGQLEQCLEDCNHALRILELRRRAKDGNMPGPVDPEDQKIRAIAELRLGLAYLWLGALGKAEAHFANAVDVEDGLEREECERVKGDLARVRCAKAALGLKEQADAAVRRSPGGEFVQEALELYNQAAKEDSESAVVLANRCFARLQAGQLQECLDDGEAALRSLRMWPVPRRPPKEPARPSRLDPPYLDDPTFKHPDQQKQKEVDWLMKHSGGSTSDLPSLPPEYEWVRDAAEKSENAWIAVKRKVPKAVIDATRKATVQLQDVMYTRNPRLIHEQIKVAAEQNRAGEGPSAKAIHQAEDYAARLEEHERQRQLENEEQERSLQLEFEECNLEEVLAPSRSGVAQVGFGRSHPVERTRKRLYEKVLLRSARARELLDDHKAAEE